MNLPKGNDTRILPIARLDYENILCYRVVKYLPIV